LALRDYRGIKAYYESIGADRLPLLGVPGPMRAYTRMRMESGAQPGADPDERILYLRSVFLGWMVFGLIAGFAMVALAYVGHLLAANTGRTVGIAVGAGAGFFCITGCLYVTWCQAYAIWARSKARKWGVESAEYARAAEHAELSNSSLIVQGLAGGAVCLLLLEVLSPCAGEPG
jgi:hypothetical protein